VTNPISSVLHICVTCKAGQNSDDDELRPGQKLYDAIAALRTGITAPVDIRPVSCLAACTQGCTASIFMPGKNFGYLLGNLVPEQAADILDYAQSYVASATGAVMPSRRAPSLSNAIIGRFPAHGMATSPVQPKEIS
jgi:predicted metal-binding protein